MTRQRPRPGTSSCGTTQDTEASSDLAQSLTHHLEEPDLAGRPEAVLLCAQRVRSDPCRSPSMRTTVSTRCSSARGPASSPSFVTCPMSNKRRARWPWRQRTAVRRRGAPGAPSPTTLASARVAHRRDRVDDAERAASARAAVDSPPRHSVVVATSSDRGTSPSRRARRATWAADSSAAIKSTVVRARGEGAQRHQGEG